MENKKRRVITLFVILVLLIALNLYVCVICNNIYKDSNSNLSNNNNIDTKTDVSRLVCQISSESGELVFAVNSNVNLNVICETNELNIAEYSWSKEGEGIFVNGESNTSNIVFSSEKLGENRVWVEILLSDGSKINSEIFNLKFVENGSLDLTGSTNDSETNSSNNLIPPVTTPVAPPVTPPVTPPNNTRVAWNEIGSWAYQLQNYSSNSLDQIKNSKFNLVVIDLSNNDINGDGIMNEFWSNSQIKSVKDSGKYVLAYFEIGAIEDFRPEYTGISEDLLLWELEDWEGEFYVKYWEEEWWTIVKGRVDQAILAGFDGAYLDMIVSYEHLAEEGYGTYEENAVLMVNLIVRISNYAKSKNPNFKIVPQNSPELITIPVWGSTIRTVYSNAIDGIGMEEMYVLATNRYCSQSWCQENIDYAKKILSRGKIVLSIDYANRADIVYDVYQKSRADGFIPYVSVLALDRLINNNCSTYNYVCDPI